MESASKYSEKLPFLRTFSLKSESQSSVNEKSSVVDIRTDEYSHLPEAEAKILREQVEVKDVKISFFTLYRYSTKRDKLLLVFATFISIVEGILRPALSLVFGAAAQVFTDYFRQRVYFDGEYEGFFGDEHTDQGFHNGTFYNSTMSGMNETRYDSYQQFMNYGTRLYSVQEFQDEVNKLALYIVYFGIADLILSYFAVYIFIDRGELLSGRIREKYLAAILRQNIGYFDKQGSGGITTSISGDTMVVQEGMSEKVCYVVSNVSAFFAAYAFAFERQYLLTFVLTSVAFVVSVALIVASGEMRRNYKKAVDELGLASTLAEETLSSIRNVQAFGIQDRLAQQFDKLIGVTEKWNIRAGGALGILTSLVFFGWFNNDALTFWYGYKLLRSGQASVSRLISVLLLMNQGAVAVSNISPHFRSLSSAIAAASKLFATIDRRSVIDSASDEGIKLDKVEGHIELKNVKFIYPSRPDVTVLSNFSLDIGASKTVALVGASGSGKSTIVGLIERFYEPLAGTITLDGVPIESLNVRWLRQQVALVSQEPSLFACSIYDNIAYGLIGTKYEYASEVEKRERVRQACIQANAMSFIDTFPEGLDTNVGDRGFLMSGGQKQRIGIARAIVSDPKILLLDEATSALDTRSEGIVQDALDKASKNRTTIVIAHRLSTIKDADTIVVMRKGQIVEMGTHSELLAKKGNYYELVQAQDVKVDKKSSAQNDSEKYEDKSEKELEEDEIHGLSKSNSGQSVSSMIIKSHEEPEEVDENKYGYWELIFYLFKLGKDDRWVNIIGLGLTVVSGFIYVFLSLLYSNCLDTLSHLPDYDFVTPRMYLFAGLFFGLACVAFISTMASIACYSYTSQKLVRKIRLMMLRQYMRLDPKFFDTDGNSSGALTSRLSNDAAAVEGLSGVTFGQILSAGMILLTCSIFSLAISWKFALVTIATMPIIVGGGFFRLYVLNSFQINLKASNEKAASFACEAASAIRTVLSLTRENDVLSKYRATLDGQRRDSRTINIKSAMFYGVSQGSQFFIFSLAYWYGGSLVVTDNYSIIQFYFAYTAVIFGSISAGITLSFVPDLGKAKLSAGYIKKILDLKPEIDTWNPAGEKVPEDCKGEIEFKDVHFRYPTRPQVPVLRGLNLKVNKGQYVALVGSSGCGKSTTIGLLEAFYRPLAGSILLDGVDISKFNINSYRDQIALVQQEPTLYAGTIKENIMFGTSRIDVTDEDVYAAARQANIHDFIESLPDGYETFVGNKGTLLSGGQKQRIAIARALIRNPKILLLDEATSALDSESEKIVQAALDAAARGRTTIAIAHRLSTIQKADIIYVFEDGKVLESGTHRELLAKRSKYYELVQLQALENQD
ncbi:P-loop containing nucleoside triphosphate hydrolase protein [Dipodascopsis uninucleata]